MDLTISLISFNQRDDLKRLLPSLREAAGRVRSEILFVDNRSTDGSAEFVRRHCPDIQIHENPNISGYGENHNLNLNRASGRYFVVMNSDMTVSPDVFERLFDFMEKNPDVGIVAPKVLNPDGSVQGLNKRNPTAWDLFLRRFLPEFLKQIFRRRMDYYEMRDIGYDIQCDVPCLSGAFMFCRTDMLKRLNGFDERYFLYFEDFDLCRRVQETHRTVYHPVSTVTHYWARSAHMRWNYCKMFVKSAWCYFRKWGFAWC